MAYVLGAVKQHVKDAANYFGPKHGFTVVYGYRAVGSVPGSDHPKGLALDFMTSNKQKGDVLVQDLIANAGAWNITYIIWWRRIWQNGSWSSYSGPSPHTNHVHVSFGASRGSGQTVQTSYGGLGEIDDVLKQTDRLAQWATNPGSWKRLAIFVIGAILVVRALIALSGVSVNVNKELLGVLKNG